MTAARASAEQPPPLAGPELPTVRAALTPDEIVARLDQAARRGRLAGFRAGARGGGPLFVVRDFGHPFEGELVAAGEPGGEQTVLRFRARLRPALPLAGWVLTALTVWPGVIFVESFLGLFPGSGDWVWSGWWYIPLAVVGGVWGMVVLVRRSRETVRAGAAERVGKIMQELGGTAEMTGTG